MRPIPKSLLIHSATLRRPDLPDAWGDCRTVSVPLAFIRIEPCTKFILDKTQRQVQTTAVLFFDCHHSQPSGLKFREGDKVDWQGREYEIQTVEPLYAGRRLHHMELMLS